MNLGLAYEYEVGGRGVPVVTRVDDKGPAFEAGVQVGDEILAVDDMSMEEGDVLNVLSSEPGEEVTLTMRKKLTPTSVSIVRTRVFPANTPEYAH